MGSQNSFLLYLAGKQGVKGIRLSLKDVGFDVAAHERARQFRIVDSDEWFLQSSKQRYLFKSPELLKEQLTNVISEAVSAGFHFVTVISETDSLVRKGFYEKYEEFDNALGRRISELDAAIVCAFDRRELEAAGIRGASENISKMHSQLI
jgi:MEDS: MEthanogen/methylotroph, DcmR Sensory domain